jgi:hypothetical protein
MERPWEFDAQVIGFLRDLGHAHLPVPPAAGPAATA